jgi:hypothetical protein
MDRQGAKFFQFDYLAIVDKFLNEKLRVRLNSGGYSPETVRVLRALESELVGLIDAERCDNRKLSGKNSGREGCPDI